MFLDALNKKAANKKNKKVQSKSNMVKSIMQKNKPQKFDLDEEVIAHRKTLSEQLTNMFKTAPDLGKIKGDQGAVKTW